MRIVVAILALFTLSAAPSCWRNGWIEVEGDGGSTQAIGRAAAFAPVVHGRRSVGFVYGRAVVESNRNYEGDLGVGYRALCGCAALGMYGFYDVRRTHRHHLYHEVTLGADLYLPKWEARVNGYIPIWGHDNHGLEHSVTIVGNQPILLETLQASLYGLNAETGPHLFLGGERCGCPEVRALVGGYFFKRSRAKSIGGYRARIEVATNVWPRLLRAVRLTVGSAFQKDRIQAGNWFIYARLSVPLGTLCRSGRCCNPCPCDPCSFLYHRIDRMDMVAFDRIREDPTSIFFKGRLVERIITVDAATPNVPAAAAAAGENSLVIVDGSVTLASPINQPVGQTIAGGGSLLPITIGNGSPTSVLLPGAPGHLTNAGPLTLVNMSQDGTIFGLGMSGDGPGVGALVEMDSAPDAMVMQSAITMNSGQTALFGSMSDRASVMDTNFTLLSNVNGIILVDSSDNILSTNVLSGDSLSVIAVQNTVRTTIDMNQITSTAPASFGIVVLAPGTPNVQKDHRVVGNTVTTSQTIVFDENTDGLIQRNRLMAGAVGIRVDGISGVPGARVTIARNTIPNAPQGLQFDMTVVDVNNNTINGATTVVNTLNSTLSGSGNTAIPFSCTDGGGNSGSISFNNGANTCP